MASLIYPNPKSGIRIESDFSVAFVVCGLPAAERWAFHLAQPNENNKNVINAQVIDAAFVGHGRGSPPTSFCVVLAHFLYN